MHMLQCYLLKKNSRYSLCIQRVLDRVNVCVCVCARACVCACVCVCECVCLWMMRVCSLTCCNTGCLGPARPQEYRPRRPLFCKKQSCQVYFVFSLPYLFAIHQHLITFTNHTHSTTENVTLFIWDQLKEKVPQGLLYEVCVFETDKNVFRYRGD